MTAEDLRFVALVMVGAVAISLTVTGVFLAFAARRIRDLNIPQDATFAETLQYTPFVVVVAIDLLDLALDVLAAPVSWVILDRLGLRALRGVAAVEALIPGTQLIPTLTLCWFGVRLLGIRY